jgi:hypothetical protein
VTVELSDNSVLEPEEGELQRFCYIVTQVEEPIALSHWVLGICPTITEEEIVNVVVTINGENQEIGDNVEITDNDPTTGCAGLKFDFGLEEAGDVMEVCFELTTTYPVGPVVVCIKGGSDPEDFENSLTICGPVCPEAEECDTTVFQTIGVCVPITVTPEAEVGTINVTCCGPATVSDEECIDTGETSCTFYVTQNLCVEVPVIFSAVGEPGTPTVTCGELSQEGCDCGTEGVAQAAKVSAQNVSNKLCFKKKNKK